MNPEGSDWRMERAKRHIEERRRKRLDETYPEYVDKHGSFLTKEDWRPHDLPIKGTTVLSCGCGIPWTKDHNRDKSALLCEQHGVVTIQEIR